MEDQTDRAGSVADQSDHTEPDAVDDYPIPAPNRCRPDPGLMLDGLNIGSAGPCLSTGPVHHFGEGLHMIVMPVGGDDRCEFAVSDQLEESRSVIRGIDEYQRATGIK